MGTNAAFQPRKARGEAFNFNDTILSLEYRLRSSDNTRFAAFSLSSMTTRSPASFERRHSEVEGPTANTSIDEGLLDCTDSGYSSSMPTPDASSPGVGNFELERTDAGQLLSRLKKTKLRLFDQEISQAVQNRFDDLSELFTPSLISFLAKRKVKRRPISIKLKVLGTDEKSAKPWVVVQCDEDASKPIKNYFNRPEVKSQYQPGDSESDLPSLEVVIHSRAPVPLATSDLASVYGNSWAEVDTLCGKLIKIGSLDEPQIATLGGVIMVEKSRGQFMLYGLTAGHVFTQEPVTGHDNERETSSPNTHTVHSSPESAPTNLESEIQKAEDTLPHAINHPQEDEDGESAAAFELEEEDFEIDLAVEVDKAPRGAAATFELEEEDVNIDLAVEVDKATMGPNSFQDPSPDTTTEDIHGQSWSKIGSIYSTSTHINAGCEPLQQTGPDQDWALVSITPDLYRPNLLNRQSYGTNVVELREFLRVPDKSKGSRAVILLSGIGGPIRGTLSLSPSFLMLGQAKSFTKTYNLVLHHGAGRISNPEF